VLVLMTVALASPARAQKLDFNESWNRGQDAFNLGRYDEARAHFERARELEPKSPGPYRYLGKIAKVQQRYRDCLKASAEAIRLKPDSPNVPEVKKDLDECRAGLNLPPLRAQLVAGQGALSVTANVEGAVVTVDGARKGATPLEPVPLPAGPVVIAVSKEGYLPGEKTADVVPGIVVDVEVELAPDPEYVAPKPVDPGQTSEDITVGWVLLEIESKEQPVVLIDGKAAQALGDGSYEASPGEHIVEVSAPGQEPWRRRVRVARGQRRTVRVTMKSSVEQHHQETMGYWLLGAAGVAGTAGIVFGLLENHAYEEARDAYELERVRPPSVRPGIPESEVTSRAEYEDLRDKAGTYGLVSNIGYGVGVVALGVSIYYLVAARPEVRTGYPLPVARKRTRVLPTVLAGEGGVGGGVSLETELRW
jgi:tetratricopeptide (TPR) repeat protein